MPFEIKMLYFILSWRIKNHISLPQTSIGNGGCGANMDWSDMLADYDGMEVNIYIKNWTPILCNSKHYTQVYLFSLLAFSVAREPWRQSTSWGDIVEEEPARPPGHGIHMHEKLSSPSRKRCKTFSLTYALTHIDSIHTVQSASPSAEQHLSLLISNSLVLTRICPSFLRVTGPLTESDLSFFWGYHPENLNRP